PVGNDRWEAGFTVEEIGNYYYSLQACVDHFQTWRKDLRKRVEAEQDVKVELLIGVEYLEAAARRAAPEVSERLGMWGKTVSYEQDTANAVALALSDDLANLMAASADRSQATDYPKELAVTVDRKQALFSSWYELFPRSYGQEPGRHGAFKDCERLVPEIER